MEHQHQHHKPRTASLGSASSHGASRTVSSEAATGAVAGLLQGLRTGSDINEEEDGSVGLFWAGATLAMSTIGAGLLSLPSAFMCLGLLPALLLLLLTALGMTFTADLLLRTHILHGCVTFDEFARLAFGPRVAVIVPVVVVVGMFGGGTAYVTIAKEVLPDLWRWVGLSSSPEGWYWSVEVWTAILVFGITFPLCLLRNIGSLRYSSTLGFSFSLFLMIVIVWRGVSAIISGDAKWHAPALQGPTQCDEGWSSIATGVSVFFFSFVFHLNVCPLYVSLRAEQRNLRNARWMIRAVVATVALLYCATGTMGYALFGADTEGNILSNFDDDGDVVVNAARIAILLCCYLCLPLLIHPLRATLASLMPLGQRATTDGGLPYTAAPNDDALLAMAVPVPGSASPEPITTSTKHAISSNLGQAAATLVQVACSWHVGITLLLISLQYAAAVLVPSIKVVFTLTGGSAVVGVCFVFPAAFALQLLPRPGGSMDLEGVEGYVLGRCDRIAALSVIGVTSALGVWSFVATVDALVHG